MLSARTSTVGADLQSIKRMKIEVDNCSIIVIGCGCFVFFG
jgi:hypothetical protein